MKTKNKSIKTRQEYKKPTLHKLNVKQTQSGRTASNNENKIHWDKNAPS